jgi:threonine synthase
MDWTWPDWIVYPTGGGTGMVGMWKAFEEIERIGWVRAGKRPRMVSVQAENCAPIVRAFQQGTERAEPWENGATLADGLRVPRAIGDFLILRAVRESGGTALAVSDASMVDAMLAIGKHAGVSAAPEGGAALVAIQQLVENGSIAPHDSVVLFNTGGALKYLDVIS